MGSFHDGKSEQEGKCLRVVNLKMFNILNDYYSIKNHPEGYFDISPPGSVLCPNLICIKLYVYEIMKYQGKARPGFCFSLPMFFFSPQDINHRIFFSPMPESRCLSLGRESKTESEDCTAPDVLASPLGNKSFLQQLG